MDNAKRMRLDKLLANMGCGTRSEVKKAIKEGRVEIDGETVRDAGRLLYPDRDEVRLDGETVTYQETIYLLMNKPPGVVSATEDKRDRTVIDLLAPPDRLLRPFPVGRLDKDTEGLLLLTNDGKLAHELLSPRKHVDKTYEALVLGEVTEEDVRSFAAGVELDDGYVTLPAELRIGEVGELAPAWAGRTCSRITLTIREGKFHQVKRMFEAVGGRVLHLRRVAMGPLVLDRTMAPGTYRQLRTKELERLLAHRGAAMGEK
ncbi:rRNA pseudouridine synthase [Paenibacillus sp. IB182496]|uniref:Pseudouridine synthase n=1 Tax=Paenibacillus sabuli TaxID=2772509 RepID=A0A927BVE2_9BACL|nr:pseudouridine synthase [Paenibacillus sabuli]MBD2846068.1 rRNA pseudouridine synthase [Paenibacillus sabuli]